MMGIFYVLGLLSVIKGEVCYDRLGCFTSKAPWSGTIQRPISHLPWAPERINTRFLLYTRDNLNKYQDLSAINRETIVKSNFRTDRKTHFIIHGFTEDGQKSWMVDMCQAMLQVEDVNCFCVDWGGGSRTVYTQAANNIRVVGAEVAYFVNILVETFKYDLSIVHLIGHSLGAHAAGEAGKRRPGIGRITAGEVCYDQLGCFPNAPPYAFTLERPIGRFPWPPERVNTRFLLFTRDNPEHFHEIHALNVSTVSATKFCPKRKSYFIIHGFLEAGENKWLIDMCQTLLQVSNVNCFGVDWFGGSVALYTQAVNNGRVVGAQLAYFIDYVMDHFGYPLSNVYLIGHSLGAHIAAEAGKRRPGIARISGLDPAGPYFENTPPEVRLDPSDAELVDVIHTNGSPTILSQGLGGFGMNQLVGHLDFFPNGGKHQPGCAKFYLRLGDLDRVMEGLEERLFCSHRRSVSFFLHSILNPDGFISYPGSSYSDFQQGAGFPCCNGSCTTMGYYADSYNHDPGSPVFFLNTGDLENLLRWRYKVMVNLTGTTLFMGSFSVSLCGKMDSSTPYIIHSGLIHSGRTYSSFFMDVEMDIYPVINMVFTWHKEAINVVQPKLGATAMTVQYGPSGAKFHFCGKELTEENIPQTLQPCIM